MAESKKNNNDVNLKKIKSLEETIKENKKEMEDLKQMISLLSSNISMKNNNFNIDKDVLFISLCPNILNLSTEGKGQGVIYKFEKFGEEQNIPYSEAKMLVKNNKRFIKGGYIWIDDEEFIESERLSQDYKKILNKEEMLNLCYENKENFKRLFSNMTKEQQEIFSKSIKDRLFNDEDIDMNLIKIINDELNIDIVKDVNMAKVLDSEMKNNHNK